MAPLPCNILVINQHHCQHLETQRNIFYVFLASLRLKEYWSKVKQANN